MNYQYILKPRGNGMEYTECKSKSTPVAKVAPELKQYNGLNNEITKTCAVLGCEDYKNVESEALFSFPEDPELRQIWTNLTGRNNWTPTDYSYICINHFSVDSFVCLQNNSVVLTDKAVPSIKLPGHVLEVEYIDEETLDNESCDDMEYTYETHDNETYENETYDNETYDNETYENETYENESHEQITHEIQVPNGDDRIKQGPVIKGKPNPEDNVKLLKLFTEIQKMQRQAVGLKEKVRCNMRLYNQQHNYLQRLESKIETKKSLLEKRKKKKSRILLSLQDKIKEDTNGLVLAMPIRYSDDLKNFALNVYKYSPQAYIYVRNTLRTMLPSTEVLQGWLKSGYHPKKILANGGTLKVSAEQTEKELSCKITLQ